MPCIAPRTITKDELFTYALHFQEPSEQFQQHVQQCSSCRRQAARYRAISSTLARKLARSDCPSTLTISEFAAGILNAQASQKVAAHLHDCHQCADELAVSQIFLVPTPSHNPPP